MNCRATAIDLFAGGGGFTTAAESVGVRVLWAANHWPVAVDVHQRNHPGVVHACQDLHQARWETVPAHDLLLASPCCQGHSKARGKDKPGSDSSRSTAWAVVSAAEYHRPQALVVENVPEFLDWTLYEPWADCLRRLGYSLSKVVVDAARAGVPQERVRVFVVGVRATVPLIIAPPREPLVPASTFLRFDEGQKWTPVLRPGRAPATVARWEDGRRRFGDRFVAPFYGSGSGLTGRSIDRPIGTITTLDRWMVVSGDRLRMLTADECRAAMGFPAGYLLPSTHKEAVHVMGNAVCPPAAAYVIREVLRCA